MSFVRDEALELFAGALNWLTGTFQFVFTHDGYTPDEAHTRLSDVAAYGVMTLDVNVGKTVTGGWLDADDPDDQVFPTLTVAYTPAQTVDADMHSGDTTLTTAGTGTAIANGDVLRIDGERILVVSGEGTTTLSVVRGYKGSDPVFHFAGTDIERVRAVNGGWLYHSSVFGAATSELLAWYDRTPADVLIAFIPPSGSVTTTQIRWPRGPTGAGFIKL